MAKKMSGRLVAPSASAVATIYVAGLLSTQPAAESVAAAGATAAFILGLDDGRRLLEQSDVGGVFITPSGRTQQSPPVGQGR